MHLDHVTPFATSFRGGKTEVEQPFFTAESFQVSKDTIQDGYSGYVVEVVVSSEDQIVIDEVGSQWVRCEECLFEIFSVQVDLRYYRSQLVVGALELMLKSKSF